MRNGSKTESAELIENTQWVIYLPVNSSPLRDNFTIAHELGHILMHQKEGTRAFSRSGKRTEEEIEANLFAAELLMPEKKFRKMAKELNKSESALAAYFGVSQAAVLVRMSVLNIN